MKCLLAVAETREIIKAEAEKAVAVVVVVEEEGVGVEPRRTALAEGGVAHVRTPVRLHHGQVRLRHDQILPRRGPIPIPAPVQVAPMQGHHVPTLWEDGRTMTGLAPAARRLDDLTLAETIDHNSIQIVPLRVAQRAPTLEVDRLVSNRIRAVDRGRITSQELSSEIVQGLVEIIVRVRGMAADVPAQGPASRISVMSIGPVAIIDPVREMAADDLVLVPADRISVMSIARAAIIDQDRGMVAVVLVRVLAAPMSDTSIVPEVVIDQDKGMVQEITMIMAAVPAGQVATDLEMAREIGRGPEIGQPMS